MLSSLQRGCVAALSGLLVAGTAAYGPLAARGLTDGAPDVVTAPSPVPLATPAPVAVLAVQRDPFDEPTADPPRSRDAHARPAPPASPLLPDTGGPLPGNLSTDVIPDVPGSSTDSPSAASRVAAVVTGTHAYALVGTGGTHEIKGLGDRVDGSPIVAIDAGGVQLANGRRLTLERGAQR